MCAFLTPSETPSGKAIYLSGSPSIKRLPLFSLTPSPSPGPRPAKRPSLASLCAQEHVDIVGKLVEVGIPMVAAKILSYLAPEDICS